MQLKLWWTPPKFTSQLHPLKPPPLPPVPEELLPVDAALLAVEPPFENEPVPPLLELHAATKVAATREKKRETKAGAKPRRTLRGVTTRDALRQF